MADVVARQGRPGLKSRMTHGCGLKPTNESMDRVLGDLKAGTSRSAGCQPCHVGQSNRWDGKNQRRTTSPGGTSVDEPGTYSGTGSQCHAMRPTDRLLQPALAGFMGSARVFTPGRRRGPGRRVRNRCIRTQGSRCNATLVCLTVSGPPSSVATLGMAQPSCRSGRGGPVWCVVARPRTVTGAVQHSPVLTSTRSDAAPA
jgi:hypothetical protein